jgi:predicted RND superfamily exporter protein
MTRAFRVLWFALPVLIVIGVIRLHFDVEVLNLLPPEVPAVRGLKLFQQHFANARELVVTVQAGDAEQAETMARVIAEKLRGQTNLAAAVTWQPPWQEHPAQASELIAHLWFNQPPEIFNQLTNRLAPETLGTILTATREQLATSMSPGDVGRLSYDPLGLTQLPESVAGSAPGFAQGQELFSSADGTFRILFVQATTDLASYRECLKWLQAVQEIVNSTRVENHIPPDVTVHYTGRPVFVAEISSGMEHDITISVGGTSLIIAILFWLAHRRVKPMLWLLTLLALILAGTLALGGLIFGAINVVSMGFAAILLGLAVDYAVVHYQEALAHPELSVPEIRRAIAPSIFWAAVTTISAFLVLNFGGLPGLAQLGSLVGVGVALSAFVMIFAFLPPLFPDRRKPRAKAPDPAPVEPSQSPPPPTPGAAGSLLLPRPITVYSMTAALLLFSVVTLGFGVPGMDPTADALRPRKSQAYETLSNIKQHLGQKREPLWLIVAGGNESDVARRLDAVQHVLDGAVSNGVLAGFTLPTALWPRPEFQKANRATARKFAAEGGQIRAAFLTNGFTENALGFTEGILETWQRAAETPGVFWPTNALNKWILEKLVARNPTNFFALGLLYLPEKAPDAAALARLELQLPRENVWLSGWELLGNSILSSVKKNLWKLLTPMIGLVLLSLWLAFRRPAEIVLSLTILVMSGLILLAVMRLAGWSWNLLNLMALPLILGTGVDYSLFMQLALRRHRGDLALAHRSVGRALLLCGGTAVAGFGALAFSSNAGMASLGQICAVGIACNMLISVFLLPVWWKTARRNEGWQSNSRDQSDSPPPNHESETHLTAPSSLYRSEFWRLGLWVVRVIPRALCLVFAHMVVEVYWLLARRRREIVIENLLPGLQNDRPGAAAKARRLFHQFAVKVVDLWRYEAGLPIQNSFGDATGWEYFASALEQKRGVLLLTPHLGNWEFGGPWLTQKGVPLQVITLAEPGEKFTELRQASRARWNIETLVIGNNPFAFVDIIRRLEAGATIALLIDRPAAATAVTVQLFGRPIAASIAAAELARAAGCVLLPVYLPRQGDTYAAHVLPPIAYDRGALRDPAVRQQLTQQIVRAFEPAIQQHLDQWYHFIPIWPK